MSTMQERLQAQNRRNILQAELALDARGISAKPKSRTDGKPLRRSLKAHESGAIRGYVMYHVSLEGQTSVVPKDKLDIMRFASIRKQMMQRLGTPQQDFAPNPWKGVDYYEGRKAFGKPMLTIQEIEARRIETPLHLRRSA